MPASLQGLAECQATGSGRFCRENPGDQPRVSRGSLLHTFDVHVVSLDEMTGIQALKRLHPTLPMKPGWVERREFEYVRHGTLSLIAGLEVVVYSNATMAQPFKWTYRGKALCA